MPNRDVHLLFDDILTEENVIRKETDTNSVHDRLDKGVNKYGPDHQELDRFHSEQGVRDWLNSFSHFDNVYQSTLTDLLRAALGHIVLDEVKYEYPDATDEELLGYAKRRFFRRQYDKKYFKS